jgi:hypothetical protein
MLSFGIPSNSLKDTISVVSVDARILDRLLRLSTTSRLLDFLFVFVLAGLGPLGNAAFFGLTFGFPSLSFFAPISLISLHSPCHSSPLVPYHCLHHHYCHPAFPLLLSPVYLFLLSCLFILVPVLHSPLPHHYSPLPHLYSPLPHLYSPLPHLYSPLPPPPLPLLPPSNLQC